MVLEEKKKLAMPKTKPEMASDSVAFSVPGTSATGMGLTLSLGDESEPESEEEDPHLRGKLTIADLHLPVKLPQSVHSVFHKIHCICPLQKKKMKTWTT